MEPSKTYISKPRAVKKICVKKPCKFCNQIETENVIIPADSQIESVALTSDVIPNDCLDYIDLSYNLTNFSVYDKNGHLCSINSGLIEKNVKLYLTGYIKPIYEHNPIMENGIQVCKLGPILEWSISSFDYGKNVVLNITTEYANYLLLKPHLSFIKYMKSIIEQINISHNVIDYMLSIEYDDPPYEDVLIYIESCVNPTTHNTFTEEDLLTHAQFVVDQVVEYDINDKHISPLADTQCIDTLIQLSGAVKPVKSRKPVSKAKQRSRNVKTTTKKEFSKATTTELVKDIFENMFADQLNNISDNINQNNELNEFNDMENVETIVNNIDDNKLIWKPNDVCEKMFVGVKCKDSKMTLIGQIQYLYKTGFLNKAHIILFIRSTDTIHAEAGDPQEIFVLQKCMDIDINTIFEKYTVVQKIPNEQWFNLGNSKLQDLAEPVDRHDKNSFFYQLQYDEKFARFEYPQKNENTNKCCNCEVKLLEDLSNKPELCDFVKKEGKVSYFSKFNLHNEMYKIGSFIYLKHGIFLRSLRSNMVDKQPFVHKVSNKHNIVRKNIDQNIYPESYRKAQVKKIRGSNETTPNPFEIAEILAIQLHNNDLSMVVRRMYRAEQIPLENYKNVDMNLLYWSEEQFTIHRKDIIGKCYVAYIVNILDPFIWSQAGPDRFYFTKMYNFITGSLIPDYHLPSEAKLIGKEVYVNYEHKYVDEDKVQYIPSFNQTIPLRGLDIFAGCGGLSRGLEDSGLVKTEWAIENDENAAAAFNLNNANVTVHVNNCNDLLQSIMSGIKTNSMNQNLPQKGEVEFICGGPPCQGFSGMNRFNSGQYSKFKNSLIVTFLSYIDYYRPKYFIMENVRNFVSFKKSMVLRLTLRCLTRMGYQCTFGILQAGNFGVPQTRRRLIIMGAAPGEKLPMYPEPTHVFNKMSSSLSVQIGDNKYQTNCKYTNCAPMRTVTIYDAWSDLPEIFNGVNQEQMLYKQNPITHIQKLLRYPNNRFSNSILTDHICKNMSPLVQARMELIPIEEGSDWRDLPNIEVELSNSVITNKLQYTHDDSKNGKGPEGTLRGVCPCATGNECNHQEYKQNNTIIPWCLPHTGNRHNNWAGLYGRLAWSGFCSTTITNPEPMGKQGRVLHPGQHRVVSVKECARSQGFKDDFVFVGTILDKHRQIGNAVPPPMGKAIGREIIKAINKKKQY